MHHGCSVLIWFLLLPLSRASRRRFSPPRRSLAGQAGHSLAPPARSVALLRHHCQTPIGCRVNALGRGVAVLPPPRALYVAAVGVAHREASKLLRAMVERAPADASTVWSKGGEMCRAPPSSVPPCNTAHGRSHVVSSQHSQGSSSERQGRRGASTIYYSDLYFPTYCQERGGRASSR